MSDTPTKAAKMELWLADCHACGMKTFQVHITVDGAADDHLVCIRCMSHNRPPKTNVEATPVTLPDTL